MNIGVIANYSKPDAPAILQRLSQHAASLEMALYTCDQTQELLPNAESLSPKDFATRIDILMALGGDGTMLSSVRSLQGTDIPVIGVNLGKLGFLTSIREEELEKALDSLHSGNYAVSERTQVETTLIRDGKTIHTAVGLNEMVVGWGASSRVATITMEVNDHEVTTYVCDGLIVSTPTGSTGHSLSAGGPIVHPEARSFVINVICPHTLTTRPVVVPDHLSLRLRIDATSKQLVLATDGQSTTDVLPGDHLEVCCAEQRVKLLTLPETNYFDVLRQKLDWRGSAIHGRP